MDLLHQAADGSLLISHKAAGADQFRYSLDWGTTFSPWQTYVEGNTTLDSKNWSGTKEQNWDGKHVIVQYYSSYTGLQRSDPALLPQLESSTKETSTPICATPVQ